MNRPENIRRANSKLHQLNIAHQIGLEIPKAIVTNDPKEANKFISIIHGPIVVKPFSRGYTDNNDRPGAIYTNLVESENLKQIHRVQYTPSFF